MILFRKIFCTKCTVTCFMSASVKDVILLASRHMTTMAEECRDAMRGDGITVTVAAGKRPEGRVWDEQREGVMLCPDVEFQKAPDEGREARGVGFPKSEVVGGRPMESSQVL